MDKLSNGQKMLLSDAIEACFRAERALIVHKRINLILASLCVALFCFSLWLIFR